MSKVFTISASIICLVIGSAPNNLIAQIGADGIRHSGPNIPGPGQKVVNRAPNDPLNPVRIVQILYHDKPIAAGVPFAAGADWLKYVSIQIRNTSPKTLIEATVQVDFRELGRPTIIWTPSVGNLPERQLYTAQGGKIGRPQTNPPLAIPPDGVVTIPLAADYQKLAELLEQRAPVSNVNACGIDLSVFYFSDDTKWSRWSYAKADQARPGQYTSQTREEFNGAVKLNP